MPISARRKQINTVLGLVLLVGLAYVLWPFFFGRSEMQEFCNSLQSGATVPQIRSQAEARGFELTDPIDGRAFVHATRSFGRFNCDLRFNSNGLESAAYADNH